MKLVLALRRAVLAVATRAAFVPATLARASVGWVFVESGWGKLHHLEKVIGFFRSLGIPRPEIQAPFAAGTELACGALLLAGLLTRLAALPLVVVMVVAIVTAKKDDIGSASDLFGLAEYLYILLLLYLAANGPGPLSLDKLIARGLAPEEKR
jgi:putative oxidoreductase